MGLPETTTDRLLAVADIVDLTPERWDQCFWFLCELAEPQPNEVAGRGVTCDSVGCIAGWAVALTPSTERTKYWRTWDIAGKHALGLSEDLSFPLFRAELPMGAGDVSDVLRRLAKLPERERNLAGAETVLSAEQYRLLLLDDDAA
jgi:hypothetical protein